MADNVTSIVFAPGSWTEDTVRAVVHNLRGALGRQSGELVAALPDSDHQLSVEPLLADLGCSLVYHAAEGHAAAINSGVASASGDFVLVLDEDFFLPAGAVDDLMHHLRELDGVDGLLLERREGSGALQPEEVSQALTDPSRLYRETAPRAFWNKGIALLCSRDAFLRVRGYDERPPYEAHGGPDLLIRMGRAGIIVEDAIGESTAAFHFRSESCAAAGHAVEGAAARRARKDFVAEDKSIYRNLMDWSVPRELRPTLVSVAISTRNRADLIAQSINSILAQSFSEFEIVVVDDGSDDETQRVVESFADPRVRYVWQEPSGISAARNRAADESIGFFTAVHDDDDIMLPWRLEESLAAMRSGIDATYGSWVNFDDETAEMVLHITRDFSQELLAHNGQSPGHATWLLPTSLVRRFRYDETLSSAVDHNLASRLMWNGVHWKHVGKVMFLRRVHSRQVSEVDGGRQRTAAWLTRFEALVAANAEGRAALRRAGRELRYPDIPGHKDLFAAFGPYLPDDLVRRTGLIVNNVTNRVIAMDRLDGLDFVLAERDALTGRLRFEFAEVNDLRWSDFVRMRAKGITGVQVTAVRRVAVADGLGAGGPVPNGDGEVSAAVSRRLGELVASLNRTGKSPAWLIGVGAGLTEHEKSLLGSPERSVTLEAAADDGRTLRIMAIGYGFFGDALKALERLPEAVGDARVLYLDAAASKDGTPRSFAAMSKRS